MMKQVHMKSLNQSKEVYINHPQPNAPQPVYTNIYMPHIEGAKMDWMVNDVLYHRFLKWKLKCENILECELTALPECQKFKNVMCKKSQATLEWINMYPGGYPKKK